MSRVWEAGRDECCQAFLFNLQLIAPQFFDPPATTSVWTGPPTSPPSCSSATPHVHSTAEMAEPQPSSVHEGMDREDPAPLPTSAEDRKAAAAMSSLERRGGDDDDAATKPNKEIDQEALGKAINRLELADKAGTVAAGEKKTKEKEEVEKRAKIKVDQADLALLVEELDLSRGKATELLKANEGDAVKAMRGFVRAAA